MRLVASIGAVTAALTLFGVPAWSQTSFEVRGTITYLAPQALPGDSVVKIEVREGVTPQGLVVGETQFALAGQPYPIPFALALDRSRMRGERAYRVRAVIFVQGRPAWAGGPAPVTVQGRGVDIGRIDVTPIAARAGDAAANP